MHGAVLEVCVSGIRENICCGKDESTYPIDVALFSAMTEMAAVVADLVNAIRQVRFLPGIRDGC